MARQREPAKLAVFTRVPQLGQVKKRLASEIGAAAALDCYLQLLEHTLDTDGCLESKNWTRNLNLAKQPTGDLGLRMLVPFQAGCKVLLGCDCPVVDKEYIDQAFHLLQSHDVVIGPVEDGGYFLLGMNDPHPDLFSQIAWSTPTVCATTIQRALDQKLTIARLPMLWDVDTVEDYHRWLATS